MKDLVDTEGEKEKKDCDNKALGEMEGGGRGPIKKNNVNF